jgi:transposase
MHTLYVGIDVSKDSSSAQGVDTKGEKIFYLCFDMDAKGFSDLLSTITSHCKDLSKVMIAMESTGCYHMNLYAFLVSKGIKTVVINPLLISNFTKLSLRKML